MTILDIIEKKKKRLSLNKEEINFWINGINNGEIEGLQTNDLLMAILLNGMDENETFYLTDAMIKCENVIDLSKIDGIKVDNHSIGGIADKVTVIVVPLLATFGLKVPKICDRGLGYIGDIIDKFEAIPGCKLELQEDAFIKQVNKIGASIIVQPDKLDLANKMMYLLKNETIPADSLSIIAASIMSKKIASGADYLFIDVKIGNGALMKTLEDARELAKLMVKIGEQYGKKTTCILTDMNEPLGLAIGNALEMKEVIDTLKGMGHADLLEVIIETSAIVLSSTLDMDYEIAKVQCFKKINNGEVLEKLKEIISSQGGDLEKLPISDRVVSIRSPKTGYINGIDTLLLGELARQIGVGRYNEEGKIEHGVGILLSRKKGDYIRVNDELARFYLADKDVKLNDILDCFVIEDDCMENKPLVYEIIK